MRSMQQQLAVLGTISAFAYRHRETKKNLCRGGHHQARGLMMAVLSNYCYYMLCF
jgi:hypothetical protein